MSIPTKCPECETELEPQEPHEAEPDVGIGEYRGGVFCPHCGYQKELERESGD